MMNGRNPVNVLDPKKKIVLLSSISLDYLGRTQKEARILIVASTQKLFLFLGGYLGLYKKSE